MQENTIPPFIVAVEGRLPLSFEQNDEFMSTTLENPAKVGNICMMITQPIPDDKACK
jgi:hypothetical protein